MFKFLKEKLKSAISKISEGVEKEGTSEEKIVEKPAEPEKKEEKGFFARIKEKFAGKEEVIEEKEDIKEETGKAGPKAEERDIEREKTAHIKKEEGKAKHRLQETKTEHEPIGRKPEITEQKTLHTIKEHKSEPKKEKHIEKTHEKEEKKPEAQKEHKTEIKEIIDAEPKPETKKPAEEHQKKGFFESIKEKIVTTKINEEQFEKLFWDLELALMENNVAVEVIDKIKSDLKEELVEKPIRRTKIEETIQGTLKASIANLFLSSDFDLEKEIKSKKEKPYVIAFFGINGSGKTTSIAKLAYMLKERNISCVLAASDTFRAASIEQLQLHADRIGVSLIKHNYGSDPAAVAFDAIKHARAKNIDAVLIDTAGRMHSNQNLIDEMKKIIRVAKPDLKIFVGESITGNDCIEQAKTFNEAVGIDGVILAKADIDEKGGAAVSIGYVTKKPILYLGTGQEYGDLKPFSPDVIVDNLGLA